jgi:hypothetical protein
MKLVATKRLRYDRKEYAPGETFDVPDWDAPRGEVLKKIQKAKDYDGPKAKIFTKPALPESEGQSSTASEAQVDTEGSGEEGETPRRRYRRRDLRPEE